MEIWSRYGPLLLFITYYLLTAALPALRLRRSHQINVHQLDDWRTVHGLLTRIERWVLRVVGGMVVLYAVYPASNQWLLPITMLQSPLGCIVGSLLILLGTLVIAIAQQQMGQLWRIDIDANAEEGMVTHGLFCLSRNPIYVGTMAVLAGFLLTLPNLVTLLAWMIEWMVLQVEIRQEEQYLGQRYGEAYRRYCQQTARWL